MQILDIVKLAREIKEEIKEDVKAAVKNEQRKPHLAAVLVVSDGASQNYVNNKIKDCDQVGFKSSLIMLPNTVSQTELLETIEKLNTQKDLDGFIVQLPLPKQIDQEKVIEAINPKRDVDGFHPENFGKMAMDMSTCLLATHSGLYDMLYIDELP